MKPDSNSQIPTTQPVPFQCQLCGECCSSWNIPIEGEKARQLLSRPWVQNRLQDTHRDLQEISEDLYRIPLTDENTCVFLGEDKRCLIEVHEGLALKPHECKRFPFATVRLPNGELQQDASAACKSIAEKLILAFQPIVPKTAQATLLFPEEPAALMEYAEDQSWLEDIGQVPEQIPLSTFRKIPVADYQALTHQWRDWFMDERLDTQTALWNVGRSLRNWPKIISGQFVQLDPNGGFSGIRATLLLLWFLRKPYRTLSFWSLLQGRQYHDPRLFGAPVSLRTLRTIPWDNRHERHLKAFVYNLLCRMRLISAGGSAQSLFSMAIVATILVQWHAKALTSLQQSGEISEKDVTTAIRLVERYYTGHQPRFFNRFLSSGFSRLIQKVFGY